MIIIGKQTDLLGVSLFVAACIHAFIILGITFKPTDKGKPEFRQQSLEVMVVRHPTGENKSDDKPDFLAQTSQQGGGEELDKIKPQVSEAATSLPLPMPELPAPAKLETQQHQQPQLTTELSMVKLPAPPPQEAPPPTPTTKQLLSSKELEIARVTADLEQKTRAYAKMPKRKSINASTKEYKYAAYLDAWRRKVERIGNLNYPDQAKRSKLYGNLVLHVAVKADGSVEHVKVLHSSGHKILDDAAVRIVRLAAPFSPFPNEIRKETDILDITRTWQFLRSGKLYSQ
ncbi:energy transducer TonB [Candidatus Thiodiazotropha sp. CDECU1]|uniref:energy transducer TonB n=1 Tax=Candidatus Thiodiazotropha sp. CDECU1 TaxID=3065865 RepID=UPI00292E614A|nr:energy transducer TonB [Candidatus Thiodiazotropha sp. CDECU1]